MRLAIVVPTLNEESTLSRNLPAALAAADEVVVSDGGSRDGTVGIAQRLGARVVSGPPGRGGGQRGRAALSSRRYDAAAARRRGGSRGHRTRLQGRRLPRAFRRRP